MAKVRVVVADEEALFREGVCALLKTYDDMEVVGEAANGKEAIEILREQTPDVVVMNIAMPIMDGAEITRRLRKVNSNIKVLLLTQYEDRDRILRGLKAGANGYIPKRATASDLVSAVLTIYQGGCFLYPSVAKTMVNDYCQRIKHPGSPDPYDRLTHREREVLKLIAEGYKSREIANFLGIAVKTVLGHRTSMMRKLSTHNRTELVKYAIRKHLINLDQLIG
jgi:DNA-binding NarL/FixJ family response regulator